MGKIPCLDCKETFDISVDKEIDDTIECQACGSDFVIVAVSPLEIEWSYHDYNDYEYDDNDDDDENEDEFDDEWDEDERNAELWNQQFAKRKRVSQLDKEMNEAKRWSHQLRFQES